MELQKRKKELIARGVTGIDETKNHGVIAQGYNPKDRPEMFVKKIVQSQKRIQYTIDQFVKENKLDPNKTEIKHSNLKSEPTESTEEIEKRIFKPDDKLYEYKNSNATQSSI